MIRTTGSHWSKSFQVFRLNKFKYTFIVSKMTDHLIPGRTKSTERRRQRNGNPSALFRGGWRLILATEYRFVFPGVIFKISCTGFYNIQGIDITRSEEHTS